MTKEDIKKSKEIIDGVNEPMLLRMQDKIERGDPLDRMDAATALGCALRCNDVLLKILDTLEEGNDE